MPTKNSKSPKITLLHVLADANRSGAPVHLLQLASGLNAEQFTSIIIGPEGPARADFEAAGFQYLVFSVNSKFDIGAINRLRRLIVSTVGGNRLSIVHCQGVRAGLFGRLAAAGLGLPVVYTEHSWTKDYHVPNPLNDALQKTILRWLDRYTTQTVAVSKAVAEFLIDEQIAPANKVVTIYHGLPAQKVLPKNSHNRLTIGSVGSLTWQKNYAWLIDVVVDIKAQISDIKVEIVGDGNQKQELQELIASKDLSENITLLGALSREELNKCYENWDLYVQPSVNEAFGIALGEAMLAGVPSLTANVGSMPELVGTQNALFGFDNKEKAAKIIINFLKDAQKRDELAQLQMNHMKQFTLQKMTDGYEKLYLSLLNLDQ